MTKSSEVGNSESCYEIGERSAHSLAVTQSSEMNNDMPIEAVAIDETTNTEQQEFSDNVCAIDERSAHSVAVTQSSGSHISIPIEKVSSLQRHESAESVATEETTNTEQQEIVECTFAMDERSSHSVAVTQSSESCTEMSIEKLSSQDVKESAADNSIRQRKRKRSSEKCMDEILQLNNSCSVTAQQSEDLVEPLQKYRRLCSIEELTVAGDDKDEPGIESVEAVATEETTNTEQQEISDNTLVDERSAHSVAVTQSSGSHISVPIEKVSSLELHASAEAVVTEETTNTEQQEISDNTLVDERSAHSVAVTQSSGSHISVPIEKVSSLELHASAEAVVTEEKTNTEQQEISDNALVDERSAHSVAATQSSGSHISVPIEKVSSLELHASAEAVVTEETTNTEQQEISDNTLVDERSAHSVAVTQSSGSHISVPIEKVSSLKLHASAEAVVTEETTNTEQQEISDNTLVDERSAHSVAVTQSSGSHISVPIEKVSSLELHASAEAVVTEETTNTEQQEISDNTLVDERSAHSVAVTQSSGSHISVPIEKVSSLELHASAEAVVTEEKTNTEKQEISDNALVDEWSAHSVAATQSSGSHISVPIEKVSSLELHASAEAVVTEETTNTEQQEISDNAFVDERSAHSVAVAQSSGSHISIPIEKVSSLELHASAEAVVTEETTNTEQSSGSHISVPIEKVSSLELHESAETVATEETINTEQQEISENAIVDERSAHSVAVAQSSGSHISVPIEKVSSLELHVSAEAVITEETTNTEQQEISDNAFVDERIAYSVAVVQSSGSHISVPIEKVSSLELHESAEAVVTEETTNTEQQEISDNAFVDGRSAHSVAVTQSSGSLISVPIEKVSSLELHASAEAVVTEETTNTEQQEISDNTLVDERSAHSVAVTQSSGSHISVPIEKVSSLELHASAEAVVTEETTNTEQQEISDNTLVDERSAHSVAVTQSSGSHISVPIEKVSSLELHASAEAVTEEKTNTEQQEISDNALVDEWSAHSVAATQSSGSHISVPIEKVSSLELHASAEAVVTEETTNTEQQEISDNAFVDERSAHSVAVAQSSGSHISIPIEKVSSLELHASAEAVVTEETTNTEQSSGSHISVPIEKVSSLELHESAETVATEETINTEQQEIIENAIVDERSAHSVAVAQSSGSHISVPIEKVSSLELHVSAEAVITEETINAEQQEISDNAFVDERIAYSVAVVQSSGSHISAPIEKVSSLELHESAEAVVTEETTNTEQQEISDNAFVDGRSAHSVAVTQSSGSLISVPIEKVSSLELHASAEAVVTEETTNTEQSSGSHISVPIEKVSSLERHESAEAVSTEETTNTEQQEIIENAIVDGRSAHSVAVTQSSGSDISVPIEKVSSLELHASAEAVVTEETTNTEQQEISDNAFVDERIAYSVAVAQSSGSHISVPIEKVSSLELHASAEAVVTEETTNTEQSSGSHISVPIKKVSSLELHESAEAVATEETTNTEEQEISENAIVDGRSAHSVAVTQSSGSHMFISIPIEKVSSLELHESAEAVATEETTNTEQQEIDECTFAMDERSAHSVAVTQSSESRTKMCIEKLSSQDVQQSAADNSIRQRKRKRSSEKCMEEILQLNNSCSVTAQQSEDLVEPLQKYRRLCNIEELTVAGGDKDEPGIEVSN